MRYGDGAFMALNGWGIYGWGIYGWGIYGSNRWGSYGKVSFFFFWKICSKTLVFMGIRIYLVYSCLSIHSWRFLEPPFFLCSLTFCSLGSNQISDEGAIAVATALQVNQSLQELK